MNGGSGTSGTKPQNKQATPTSDTGMQDGTDERDGREEQQSGTNLCNEQTNGVDERNKGAKRMRKQNRTSQLDKEDGQAEQKSGTNERERRRE